MNRYLVKTLPFVDKDRVAFQGWVRHFSVFISTYISLLIYCLTFSILFLISYCLPGSAFSMLSVRFKKIFQNVQAYRLLVFVKFFLGKKSV